MIPIISIVGKSDSGKTTLIEKLMPELTRRGHRIATVKHDVHGFEVDREVIASRNKVALIRDVDKDLTLEEVREKLIQDVDLILSEGYKKDVQPKIEIFRREKHQELLCTKEDNLVAIVSNQTFDIGIPCFDLEDTKGLADFIEKRILVSKAQESVSLKVDGKEIPLNRFVRGFLSNAIGGMVGSLKDCETAERIEIHIEKE
ncbi:MAG: molybdopterin-guanine dinucleotide biosynthesis protein B [Thermodesulfobacteriota bacterium]